MKHAPRLLCLLACLLFSAFSRAEEVVLVASPFPKEVLSAYKKAFERQSPDLRVEFVNFSATHIVSFLRDRAEGSRPDVFWGSSPDTFSALKRLGLLQALVMVINRYGEHLLGVVLSDNFAELHVYKICNLVQKYRKPT